MSFNQIAPATIQFRGVTPWDRYPWFQVLRPCTQLWIHNAYLAGGVLTYQEIQWAETYLAQPLFAAGLEPKIVALYPFLGDANSARAPLHNLRGVGPAANRGTTTFVNSTLGTSALGLITTNLSDTQFLDTGLTPNMVANVITLSSAFPAGMFLYQRAGTFTTTTTEAIGTYSDNQSATMRCTLDLRSNRQAFGWCSSANQASVATAAANVGYYGEASSLVLRTLYRAGSSIATNTTSDGNAGSRLSMIIGGMRSLVSSVLVDNGYQTAACRLGVCGWTDGTLGAAGAAALDTILNAFCTVTGR